MPSCSFVGNRGLCGVKINSTCKDDGSPGTNTQSASSGKAVCFFNLVFILYLISYQVFLLLFNDALFFLVKIIFVR